MKITTDPLQYCRTLPKGMRAVLLYGPNRLVIQEAVTLLQQAFLPEDKNDFSVVTVTPDRIKQNPTLLADEMSSFGFFASNKLIHIKETEDATLKAIQAAMELPGAGHFLVIEAGELPPRSALRQWGEKTKDVACLACYMLEGAKLARFVQDQFAAQNARISGDAVALVIDRLGNDLSALKNLVPQLADFVGGQNPVITLEHIEALLVDQAEQEMDGMVQAVADRNMAVMDRALHNLSASDISMVAVLRMLQYYFYRLRQAHAAVHNGKSPEEAMATLKPPVFFKMKTPFLRHLRNWNLAQIDMALAEFLALEAACKKTGTPELNVVQYRLMRLCLRKQAA